MKKRNYFLQKEAGPSVGAALLLLFLTAGGEVFAESHAEKAADSGNEGKFIAFGILAIFIIMGFVIFYLLRKEK